MVGKAIYGFHSYMGFEGTDSLQKTKQIPQRGWAKSQGRDVGELMSILSSLERAKKVDSLELCLFFFYSI